MGFSTKNIPTKEKILERFHELDIFNFYMNARYSETDSFLSPLRNDNHPTCNFYRAANGRLLMIDHAGYFHGDCFEFVVRVIPTCNNYYDAVKRVWKDLSGESASPTITKDYFKKHATYYKKKFQVKVRNWGKEELAYWDKYHITQKTLVKYNVFPIDILWIGSAFDQNIMAKWDKYNPVYGYYLGEGTWKIYFPLTTGKFRFLSNGNVLQGSAQLVESDILVITKSLKDVMVLYQLGIPSVAPHSEGIVIPMLHQMIEYYEKVFIFFDNDFPGKRGSVKYKQRGCIPLLMKDEKDISDYTKKYGWEQTKKLVNETKTIFGY